MKRNNSITNLPQSTNEWRNIEGSEDNYNCIVERTEITKYYIDTLQITSVDSRNITPI